MHPEIAIVFPEHLFEYDVYSLCRAFWPSAEASVCYDGEEEEACADAIVRLEYIRDGGYVVCSFKTEEKDTADELGIPRAGTFTRKDAVSDWDDTSEAKNAVKSCVYGLLSELTGRSLPWGDLTGIRPVKLVSGLLDEGMTDDEVLMTVRGRWHVSREKSELALATARREKEILDELRPEDGVSVYIGVPFCPSICLYCSFGSHPLSVFRDRVKDYLAAVKKEIDFLSVVLEGKRIDTVYIGGGTPTALEAEELEVLMEHIGNRLDLSRVREYTVEAGRPDTIDEEKLGVIRRCGAGRISINPQSMNAETLRRIGREHTPEETGRAFRLARGLGFYNINMDIIVGLPGEGEAEVKTTLERIGALDPESLTVHSLAMKRATRLHLEEDEYRADSFHNSEAIMKMCADHAASKGMGPYYLYRQKNIAGNFENVGYARRGKEGLYNILIMEQRQSIFAAGPGAVTRLIRHGGNRHERIENVKDLKQYLDRTDEMIERKRKGIALFS